VEPHAFAEVVQVCAVAHEPSDVLDEQIDISVVIVEDCRLKVIVIVISHNIKQVPEMLPAGTQKAAQCDPQQQKSELHSTV
jgi:hypothetical protein